MMRAVKNNKNQFFSPYYIYIFSALEKTERGGNNSGQGSEMVLRAGKKSVQTPFLPRLPPPSPAPCIPKGLVLNVKTCELTH